MKLKTIRLGRLRLGRGNQGGHAGPRPGVRRVGGMRQSGAGRKAFVQAASTVNFLLTGSGRSSKGPHSRNPRQGSFKLEWSEGSQTPQTTPGRQDLLLDRAGRTSSMPSAPAQSRWKERCARGEGGHLRGACSVSGCVNRSREELGQW